MSSHNCMQGVKYVPANSKFEWTKAEQESHIVQLSLLLLLITEYCHSVAFQIIKLTKVKTRPKTTVKLIDILKKKKIK